jgi:ATP/maltotriose-dependent transcriptional regulator MalT
VGDSPRAEAPRRRADAILCGVQAGSSLSAAERALEEGRWGDARAAFEAAVAVDETPEALEGLAWAARWLDDGRSALAARERAYALYLERGDFASAGRAALWLSVEHSMFHTGVAAVAGGWLERARRLLEGLEPTPEHAWIAERLGRRALAEGDTETARSLGVEAVEIASTISRPDLEALGMALQGQALVAENEIPEGMRLLDEAAAAVAASETSDLVCVGATYCKMLNACELIGDIERASEWCERTTEVARRHALQHLFSLCRTSYAGVLTLCGRWVEAEAELLPALRDFDSARPGAKGEAVERLADLRRRQGRFEEAAELFAQVEGSRSAVLGRAALALDRGDSRAAADLAERFLRQSPAEDRWARAAALELLVRARAARSELKPGERALSELRSIAAHAPTERLQAMASAAAGALARARGDAELARRLLEDSADLFARSAAPFEAARARLDLAGALRECGRAPEAAEEAEAARRAVADLGAGRDLERAAGFAAGLEADAGEDGESALDSGLTPRELEVLALIAEGLSNREIATRLVVSEHTVHRHTTNLYRKLGVSSRAAATTYAHRHRLA